MPSCSRSNADLAPLLQEALQPALAAYEELKARGGRLDFLDLLIKARDLIRDNAAVREELQGRFTHYFVDEFQDTDPIQAELLLLLAADNPQESNWLNVSPIPGKLFLVGDPKQSIYRFRRADIAIYLQVKQMLLSRGAEPLYLNTSFRSPPSLQSFVNAAFAPAMAGTTADGEYVPLEKWRTEIIGRPTIVALPIPRPYGDYGKIVNFRIDESLPEATGAFIDWLVNREWLDGRGERRHGRYFPAPHLHSVPTPKEFFRRRHSALRSCVGSATASARSRGRSLLSRSRGDHRVAQCPYRDRMAG